MEKTKYDPNEFFRACLSKPKKYDVSEVILRIYAAINYMLDLFPQDRLTIHMTTSLFYTLAQACSVNREMTTCDRIFGIRIEKSYGDGDKFWISVYNEEFSEADYETS